MRIDLDSHSLRVEVLGHGEPSMVCLHGLADTLEIWNRVVEPLSDHGQVVVFDQRAHGDSTAPAGPCSRDDLVADVIAVLDHLSVTRAILVGHSMGGIVAMATTLAHPSRVLGLVLIGTASECSEPAARWYEKIAQAAEAEGLAGLARAIYGPASKQLNGDPRGLAQITRCLVSLYEDPLTPRLGSIRCPAIVLVGEKDPMGPGASFIIQRHLPNATVEVISDRGHWIHLQAPEVVVNAVERLRYAAERAQAPRSLEGRT